MITYLLIGTVIVLIYVIVNLLRKLEFYENTIENFYQRLSLTLHTMKAIDNQQWFEEDDEVGFIFDEMKKEIFRLRNLIYEDTDAQEETNKPGETEEVVR